jgi:hypothetical protein
MFEFIFGDGWTEERKSAHRIEMLLQEEIKLLRQILAALPQQPPATFQLVTGAKMTRS